jgi:hypothetical protein
MKLFDQLRYFVNSYLASSMIHVATTLCLNITQNLYGRCSSSNILRNTVPTNRHRSRHCGHIFVRYNIPLFCCQLPTPPIEQPTSSVVCRLHPGIAKRIKISKLETGRRLRSRSHDLPALHWASQVPPELPRKGNCRRSQDFR